MRRLWIRCRKASAVSSRKMKVYIEDENLGDVCIQDVSCRKLGELKNGETKHFSIENDGGRVFVLAGKASRSRADGCAEIPKGQDDVFLSGRCASALFRGRFFQWDGQGETLPEEKSSTGKVAAVALISAVLLGLLLGLAAGWVLTGGPELPAASHTQEQGAVTETYRCQELQITLGEEFHKVQAEEYAACYVNADTAVLLLREDFSAMEGLGDLTVEDYGAMVLKNNGFNETVQLTREGDLTAFCYNYKIPETGDVFSYYTVLLKSDSAFWMVQFSSPEEDMEQRLPLFRHWAESICFLP